MRAISILYQMFNFYFITCTKRELCHCLKPICRGYGEYIHFNNGCAHKSGFGIMPVVWCQPSINRLSHVLRSTAQICFLSKINDLVQKLQEKKFKKNWQRLSWPQSLKARFYKKQFMVRSRVWGASLGQVRVLKA